MANIHKINHIAIVVNEMENSLVFWRDALGLKLTELREVPAEAARIGFMPVNGSEIELVQPTTDDSGLARYLSKRGPGLHHICLEVSDISAMIRQLKDKDIGLINEDPKIGTDGRKYVFVNPKSTSGVLVELYEIPKMVVSSFPILKTRRLVLREFSLEDIPAVYDMLKREDINEWLETDAMKDINDAEQRVRGRMSLFSNGMGYRWAITLQDDPEKVIGSCGYFHVRRNTQTMEMGYELLPNYWRRGIMTEALEAVVEFGFHGGANPIVHRMEALVDPRNIASIRLLENLRFQKEAIRRQFGYWKGAYRDVLMYSLLNNEESIF